MGRKRKIYPDRFCKVCGRLLHKKQDLYCSRECQVKGRSIIQKYICLNCGKEVERRSNGRQLPHRFCSNRCTNLFYGAIRSENKSRKEQIKHIKSLQNKAERIRRELQKLEKKIEKIKPCFICGELMVKANHKQTMCAACRKKSDNIRRDKRLYRNGKPDLSITLEKLYNRDLGICQICNRVIIFGNDTNADYYPSIDHIKPLSKGGTHTWDNVQLACRKCNTLKGAKIS